uniref:Reverse transcriptase Ty1/copia-type domain-containing protein n=1 Tax=Tanacetum cinerariifolium TaxID=118510 RepID=A0A6L2NW35_TANCI|nr:hypothetical protein [Tanacetum cinerariifolium]
MIEEPKRVHQALKDQSWIEAMQEELLQFKMQKVWILVDLSYGKRAIVARIEAIRLFLAYASFMGFMVYQMDVKSAFLYETIKEEVYVYQPLGFEDPDHPDKVYKVVKALYGLHQAPRAWYETLANYLLENGFQRDKIDQTLFIKRQKGGILLVQIYVDDIIFGAKNKDLCKSFKKLIKDKFQMSSMGELTFFLGLQVKQKKDMIFISQDKYVAEFLRKFRMIEGKSASTPIYIEKPLLKDPDGEDVDVHTYRSMTGSLMYLTSSRPDIMFAKCKKQTVVATSSTEAEYVAATSRCVQVKAVTQVARQDQRIEAREKHIRNLEALLEAEVDMKGAAEAKNVELAKELESLYVQFSNHQNLKYPLVDQLEKLKDTPIDMIMASLFFKSDSRKDAPQWIRELRPSSSQQKILVYPEVHNPKDPWSFKDEILLEDAIVTNVSRAEKKIKCQVVSYPRGIAILLANAATQTEIIEDEASPKLIRSKSLPPLYNLDWP